MTRDWLAEATAHKASQKKPARAWLDEAKLPRLFYGGGAPVELPVMRYLIHRQSKVKTPALEPEVRALAGDLDRSRAGDFGLALFDLFIAQKANNKDKFCLVLAAAFGDQRLMPLLEKKIVEWPEVRRGKLAEFAITALAGAGDEVGLFWVDAVERRLRTGRRKQADLARSLLDEAAKSRGLDREALVDAVLPWHGFTERTRVLTGSKRFTVSVGLDLKMRYVSEDDKVAKSLSKTIPDPERAEVAALAKNLRHLVKVHSTRLVDCTIGQTEWPVDRWRALFLRHPILAPFAARLVWARYLSGDPCRSFRPLEDGTLTDAEDEEVTLDGDGAVRLLHPALIDAELAGAWREHLADYEIEPPFAQLDRPAGVVPEALRDTRFDHTFRGRPWLQFERGRFARRVGYKPLTVYEEQHTACFKTYPGRERDIDCVLVIDQAEEVVVGHYFAPYRPDTVRSGTFHLPSGEDDPLLLPLGSVPRPIYAEAIAELAQLVE